MAFQSNITIDGVNINSYVINYKVIYNVKDITPVDLKLNKTILDVISLEKDQEIIITRGNPDPNTQTIFRGNISSITKDGGKQAFIEGYDKLWLLSRQTITISYDKNIDDEAGKISSIASDLITRGGLTPDVEDSGTAVTLDKYIIRGRSILDCLQELADLIDYWLYYDPQTNTVKFKSRGFEEFDTTLQVGVNLVKIPRWEYDYTKMVNDITLTGDRQEIETDEGFGSGVSSLILLNKPESVKVKIGNELLAGGVSNQDSTFDYSVDKENKKILFNTATSGSGTVSYSFMRPIKVRKTNPESIAKYGTYAIPRTINTIQTTSDAESKANEITTKFASPLVNVRNVEIYDIYTGKAGQKVQIIDSVNDENRVVNIRRYVYNYPIPIDSIHIDDEPIYDDYILKNEIKRRIARLERKNEVAGDLITQLISFFRSFKPRRRFSKLLKKSLTATGWVWGDLPGGFRSYTQITSDGGVWGGEGTQFSGNETVKLVQGDMTYYEDLRDTAFVDSTNTDAEVDTAAKTIFFSSGSVFQTEAIDVGTTLNTATLFTGISSGSFKLETSQDGKTNWQTILDKTLFSFNNSGTSTYLRITEDGGSTGTIQNLTNDFGEITSPALKFVMTEG